MKYTSSLSILFFLLICGHGQAQRTLSLQECVDIAYTQSLDLANSDLSLEMAEVNANQARQARYPNISGSSSYGYNIGRTIDPTTNNFANQSSTFQTFRLDAGVTLFQGGVLQKSVEQATLSGLAALKRKEALIDNIGLQVAQNYLNALLAQESENLANYQIDLTKTQLDRLDRLISAGSIPANDRLELEAQLVRDEQQIILSKNNYDLALLNLKNLLRLDVDESIDLEIVDVDAVPIDESILDKSLPEVYDIALTYQPSIKADSIDMKVAELDKKINKGRLLPSVSLGGSISTNFSSLAKQLVGQEDFINDVPVIINGMTVDVGFPGVNPLFDDTPYFDQVNNNLGYGVGLTLRVPIYNNNVSRANVERSEINIKQVRIQNEINRQNLKSTIYSAMSQARAAKQSYLAAKKSVSAQEVSLANLEKKLLAGSANNFDFINSKNNLSIAENSLLQSKYDYIFKLKVIDYYLGKPLKF